MDEQKQVSDNWGDYITNYLQAEDVQEELVYVVINAAEVEMDGEKKITITLERGTERSLFTLNKTNTSFIKNAGVKSPRDLLGKKIQFKIVSVYNPTAKKEQPGLRIKSVA